MQAAGSQVDVRVRVRFIFFRSGGNTTNHPIEEVGPSVVFDAAFVGEQGVGARIQPAACRPLEPAPDGLPAGAFHEAGSDRQSALPAAVAGIRPLSASNWSMQSATALSLSRLRIVDDAVDLPGVQLLLDPLHPRLPFAPVLRQGLHCGGGIFEGMELIEGEGRIPSGEDLLADVSNPCRRQDGTARSLAASKSCVPMVLQMRSGMS